MIVVDNSNNNNNDDDNVNAPRETTKLRVAARLTSVALTLLTGDGVSTREAKQLSAATMSGADGVLVVPGSLAALVFAR